jgi:hypothetical protein
VPHGAIGSTSLEVVHESGNWIKLGDVYLSLHTGCLIKDNRLQLPDTGAVLCGGSVYFHRLQQNQFLSIDNGMVLIRKVENKISIYLLERIGTLDYKSTLPGPGYTSTCYGDQEGWKGLVLYKLVPIHEDFERIPQ